MKGRKSRINVKAFLRGFFLAMVLGFIPLYFSVNILSNSSVSISIFARILFTEQTIIIYPTITHIDIAVAFTLSIPSQLFYYFYQINPETDSFKRQMIVASLFTILIPLVLYLPLIELNILIFFTHGRFDTIMFKYPLVVLVFLVFFPMIIHECKSIYIHGLRGVSGIDFEQQIKFEQRAKRARYVGVVIAFSSLILPAVTLLTISPGVTYLQNSYAYSISTFALFYITEIDNLSAIGNAWSISIFSDPYYFFLPIIPIVIVIFNILFVKRVIQQYNGLDEGSSAFRAGTLGIAWSTLWASIMTLFMHFSPGSLVLPVPSPFLLIVGLVIIYYKDPIHSELRIHEVDVQKPLEPQDGDCILIPFAYVMHTYLKRSWRKLRDKLGKNGGPGAI